MSLDGQIRSLRLQREPRSKGPCLVDKEGHVRWSKSCTDLIANIPYRVTSYMTPYICKGSLPHIKKVNTRSRKMSPVKTAGQYKASTFCDFHLSKAFKIPDKSKPVCNYARLSPRAVHTSPRAQVIPVRETPSSFPSKDPQRGR